MNIQIDRFGQVQTENTHDRFCVDDISSGYKIEIVVKFCDLIYERFHFIDRVQRNLYSFHKIPPSYDSKAKAILPLHLSSYRHILEKSRKCLKIVERDYL